jgi:radical SAM superfamily enzyme YgiQ (UPF0313 family)
MNVETSASPKDFDIVFLTLPRLELRSPITAPAILKASVENVGYRAFCLDLNIELWQSLDSKKYGHVWFDTDLSFRHEDKFNLFWEEAISPRANEWVEKIRKLNPRWVGITIFSQRSKWIAMALCKLIRETLPHIKIVVGGPYAAQVGPKLFSDHLVDCYVVGEGESAIVDILKGTFDKPGINGNPPSQMSDLNSIPIPNYDDYDLSKYPKTWQDPRIKDETQMGSDFIYITGSRGCVRKCDFCDVQSIWPKYRYRSGENIALEMKVQNNKYGTKKFLFTDSLLNGSVKQLEDLCKTLLKYRDEGFMSNVIWQGQFIARPENHMKEEVYALMREAGCFFVSIGVESGSEKVRQDMNKKFDNAALDFTFNACAKHNIQMAWLLLVGYPTETEEDFQETLNLLEKYQWINKMGLVRSIALGPTLDIVPGSPLFNRQKDLGITWDENNNWIMNDNNRVVRIQRWLRLKKKCLELGYPIVEKATDHLMMELEKYGEKPTVSMIYDHFNENPGGMDRND